MQGLDSLNLALSNDVVAAAEIAFIEAALHLGVSAEVLQAQLSAGDLLAATVQPPQNGHDVLEIFGRDVAAQLPPDVRPGETLLLEVTGFSGNRIVVRNLGLYDPQSPVRTVTLPLPQASPQLQLQPQARTLTQSQTQTQTQPQQQAQATRAPLAPPREVLLAASIRPSLAPQPPSSTARRMPNLVQTAAQSAAKTVQRVIRTAGDVLKVIRVPDTPFTRTAAAIASQAPARLPVVLQRLEAALPHENADPRIATLRTLIAFTARMNPSNEETLGAQIAAYVSHIVEGAESKVQQLLQAHVAADAAQTPAPQAPHSEGAIRAQTQPQLQSPEPPPKANGAIPHSPAIAQARVVERTEAAQHDLKSVVLSLLRDPQIARTPTLTQALNETLITLTGTQFNVLSANAQDSGTISFALPLFYHEGGKPAYVRIARDAQPRGSKLDADNFHVAFVLDTANLGTVAIDLESSGRAVRVSVKTERASAASRFADTLDALRSRLEDLRYRVTSASAQALKKDAPPAAAMQHNSRNHTANGLDLRA